MTKGKPMINPLKHIIYKQFETSSCAIISKEELEEFMILERNKTIDDCFDIVNQLNSIGIMCTKARIELIKRFLKRGLSKEKIINLVSIKLNSKNVGKNITQKYIDEIFNNISEAGND